MKSTPSYSSVIFTERQGTRFVSLKILSGGLSPGFAYTLNAANEDCPRHPVVNISPCRIVA
ncbi:hypothetical protein SERLA73DRAFT_80594 [Serpula lacrymans var. lacrymans S7.3]|uniref:Uncharacterized protein n=1 Tax=Serpula lacrymans var. lacrymans (strain S7.3) TaxID=936435 RepID=F8QJZ4_SERL3|nr:hypothetical protein SERLA73DRAFT_80594 [Serpula lacrymans var. lacrymans S7.3]